MTLFWLKLMLLMGPTLLLPLLIIHLQPYDHPILRAVLTPPDHCSTPCFMDIRPGAMTQEEALTQLKAHSWVARVQDDKPFVLPDADMTEAPRLTSVVHWEWTQDGTAWVAPDSRGALVVTNGLTRALTIHTRFLLGDLLLTLGSPDNTRLIRYSGSYGQSFAYDAWYADRCLWLVVAGEGLPRELYRRPVTLTFQPDPPQLSEMAAAVARCQGA
jgi:hypothetical protein